MTAATKITHSIWVTPPMGSEYIEVTVSADTNEQCIAAAQAAWEGLRKADFEMRSQPPTGQW